MTDQELETILRDTFHEHEDRIHGRGERLLSGTHARARQRRNTIGVAGASLAAAIMLVSVTFLASLPFSAGPSSPNASADAVGTVPTGWRLESSLGVEIAVPPDWAINDFGCNMTNRPTVVRGQWNAMLCHTIEPATKEIAFIGGDGQEPSPERLSSERDVVIDGLSAKRAEWTLSDGRFGGWISIPSQQIEILVRTLDRTTTRRILDSTHIVDIDHAGCARQRPVRVARSAPSSATFVMTNPASISICHYGGFPDDYRPGGVPLLASAKIGGETAVRLAAALNDAPVGYNPDADGGCEGSPPFPDVVLHLHGGGQGPQTVWITYSSCVNRGIDNGVSQAHITHSMLEMIRDAVKQGYSVRGRTNIPQ